MGSEFRRQWASHLETTHPNKTFVVMGRFYLLSCRTRDLLKEYKKIADAFPERESYQASAMTIKLRHEHYRAMLATCVDGWLIGTGMKLNDRTKAIKYILHPDRSGGGSIGRADMIFKQYVNNLKNH